MICDLVWSEYGKREYKFEGCLVCTGTRERENKALLLGLVVICERESERCLKALYYLKLILIQRQSRELEREQRQNTKVLTSPCDIRNKDM